MARIGWTSVYAGPVLLGISSGLQWKVDLRLNTSKSSLGGVVTLPGWSFTDGHTVQQAGSRCNGKQAMMSQNWNKYEVGFQWRLRGGGILYKLTWDRMFDRWQERSDWARGNWWLLARDREHWQQFEWDFVQMNLPLAKPRVAACEELQETERNPWHEFLKCSV